MWCQASPLDERSAHRIRRDRLNFIVVSADNKNECLGRVNVSQPMENSTMSLGTILTQRLWNPACHPAEPPSENNCSSMASGETPRHVMVPVTIEKELSMRSIPWLGLILTAVCFLFCGCGGGPSAVITPQPPSALTYTTATADYTVGTPITPNSPTSSGGAVTA